MNDNIQSFWYGTSLSTMELLSISSFLKNGHNVDIYAYEEISNIPKGVNLLDANLILDKKNIFFDSSGGIAAFSDWFRYKLLYEKGGWWVDMDMVCLKPFIIGDEYCFATENFSSNHQTDITCCVIKSPKKAEFLKMILDYIESFPDHKDIEWGTFGPKLIASVLRQFESKPFIQPVETFCPVDWTEMQSLTTERRIIPENAIGIHMWNNLWRINNINKDITYHPDTIFEQLKAKYLQPENLSHPMNVQI
ncbi:glycosyltransferase [Pedobacter sp. 22226]|uniref:glycosyltransferase n=1 Tax=Pedobacter sp. 22226 TaxID=3453894 RepID=UPI003F84C78E